jgi:hypothetical protein
MFTLTRSRRAKPAQDQDGTNTDDEINLQAYEQLINFLRERLQPTDLAQAEGMIEHLFNVEENIEDEKERKKEIAARAELGSAFDELPASVRRRIADGLDRCRVNTFEKIFPDAARFNQR